MFRTTLLLALGILLSVSAVSARGTGEGNLESTLFVVGKSREKFQTVYNEGKSIGYFYYEELCRRLLPMFRGLPYGASPVAAPADKTLINLTSFDCVTFVETWWAICRTLQQVQLGQVRNGTDPFMLFARNLNRIRYFGGENCGMEERIHYFTQAMEEMERAGLIFNVATSNGDPFVKKINYITKNPGNYGDLATSPRMKSLETVLNKTPRNFYKIEHRHLYYPMAKSGDIVGFASDEEGLDVSHVGVLTVGEGGEVLVSHASSRYNRVVVEQSLDDYIRSRGGLLGIFVFRPRFD